MIAPDGNPAINRELHPIATELYSFIREDRKWRLGKGQHSSDLHSTAKNEQPRSAGGPMAAVRPRRRTERSKATARNKWRAVRLPGPTSVNRRRSVRWAFLRWPLNSPSTAHARILWTSPKIAQHRGLGNGAQSFRTLMYGPSPVRKVAALMADIRLRSCMRPLMERRVALRAMMEIRAPSPDQASGLSALRVRQV